MKLVEQHIIKSTDRKYKDLNNLCFLSKNLYNQALYRIRQQFFKNGSFKNYYKLNEELKKENQIDYRALPANTSQEVLKLVCQNYKSFFNSLKKHISSVKIPNYLHKTKGRQIVIYNHMTLPTNLLKDNIIKLPKSNIQFKTKQKQICQVRIIPKNNYIVIEVIYNINEKQLKDDNKRYMSIDLGVNNLCTCTSNVIKSFIINGKPVKSINQYYNKKSSELKNKLSQLKKEQYTSKKLYNLTLKRNNKIKDYFHKVSHYIINQLVNQSINTLIIGKNDGWKQEINNGKKNNQNFVQIPFNNLINILKYKCQLEGINVVIQEESYTSKASFFNNDFIPVYNKESEGTYKFSGRRHPRGIYKVKKFIKLNSDINGSLNIMRKYLQVACDEIISPACRGLVMNPQKINIF